MSDKLENLHQTVATHLSEIAALFQKPDEVKMTLIIRTPWLPDGGVVLSDDDYDLAIAELRRLETSPTTQITGKEHP